MGSCPAITHSIEVSRSCKSVIIEFSISVLHLWVAGCDTIEKWVTYLIMEFHDSKFLL